MLGANTIMKTMNTRKNTNDFVRYRNKVNGTVWFANSNQKTKVIEGEEYLHVFDPNQPSRQVMVAKHTLEKLSN